MRVICDYCGRETEKSTGHVNRAKKINSKLYCDRTCAGKAKRHNKSQKELKKEKAEYDKQYREKNREVLKKKNQAYNKTKAGRATQKRNREKMKEKHLAYCRTPEYRAWKKEYDKKHRAKKNYGEYWESAIILNQLEEFIDNREVKQELGLINKSQNRKRKLNNYGKAKC